MNIRFAVYDLVTGKINSTGSCPPEDMDLQKLNPGEGILPCAAHMRSATHCVDVGSLSFRENPSVAVYDKTTGAIVRKITCFRADLDRMANPKENQAALECAADIDQAAQRVDVLAVTPQIIKA